MSDEIKPPFQSDLLPLGGQMAADTFISVAGQLSQNEVVPISYADLIAGLIYAVPVLLALADEHKASYLMTKRFQEYVSADYFPTLVAQWSEYMQRVIDSNDSDTTTSDPIQGTDLSKDPRYN